MNSDRQSQDLTTFDVYEFHLRTTRTDGQDRTARLEQPGQDGQKRTTMIARKGHLEKENQNG
jgi:hypothetical protein